MKFSVIVRKRFTPASSKTYDTPAQEFTYVRVIGPCLVCEEEIEYHQVDQRSMP